MCKSKGQSGWGGSGEFIFRFEIFLEAQLAFDQHERGIHLSTCKLD